MANIQTDYSIGSEADLNNALQQIDIGGASSGQPTYTFTFTADLKDASALSADLDAINIGSGSTLNILGANYILDGANIFRGFFVISGTVNISDLTIQNTSATGGAGGAGLSAGGGGMGAGGGLFVNSGASVTLTNVDFTGDAATGGAGGEGAQDGGGGGGGGMGGAGGSSGVQFAGGNNFGGSSGGNGGGGLGLNASGGDGATSNAGAGASGSAGIALGASSGGDGARLSQNTPAAGGADGGGGGGGFGPTMINGRFFPSGGGGGGIGGSAGTTTSGGKGGDFGGGGGSGNTPGTPGGDGGFGGGGGGSASGDPIAGNGGFGGGGGGKNNGSPGAGGFGGGTGGPSGGELIGSPPTESTTYPGGGGGGGAAFGGAVFVRDGGTLTINDSEFSGGSVTGGAGGVAGQPTIKGTDGQAAGTAIFLQGSGTITYEADTSETISDTIVDEEGWVVTTGYTPPTGYTPGSYTVDKTGAGALTLSGTNAYSGGTTIEDGTLDLTVLNAAGIGEMNFGGDPANNPTTLQIEKTALDNNNKFDNTLGIFRVGDTIDLRGIGTATGTSVDAQTDGLTISGGTTAVTMQLNSTSDIRGIQANVGPERRHRSGTRSHHHITRR